MKRKEAKPHEKLFCFFRNTKQKGSEIVSVSLRFASRRKQNYKRKWDTLRWADRSFHFFEHKRDSLFLKERFTRLHTVNELALVLKTENWTFIKNKREWIALFTKATRVNCSLQKERKERMSDSLFLSKNEWFAWKTKEQIPAPSLNRKYKQISKKEAKKGISTVHELPYR